MRPPKPRHLGRPRQAPTDPSDAFLVLAQTAEWIRSADTKTSFALAALTLLLNAVAGDAHLVSDLWSGVPAPDRVVLAVSIGALMISFAAAASVLMPRTSVVTPNRFSWPWLAKATDGETLKMMRTSAVKEAWLQARGLAVVARRKYFWLRLVMLAGSTSAVSYLAWKVFFPIP